ncbi:MAG: hypothetical protein ABSC94_29820 [Polyangiaceae bacterium]|jgi:hypothetical protein
MGVVGQHPETGLRVEMDRPEMAAPWEYHGEAVTPSARWPLLVTVSAEGLVTVVLSTEAPAGLSERVRLLMRAAWKHGKDEGQPPPRRIVRWRADR